MAFNYGLAGALAGAVGNIALMIDPKKNRKFAQVMHGVGKAVSAVGAAMPEGKVADTPKPIKGGHPDHPWTQKGYHAPTAAQAQQMRQSTALATPQPNVPGQNNNNMKVQNPAANKQWDSGSLNKILNSHNLARDPSIPKDWPKGVPAKSVPMKNYPDNPGNPGSGGLMPTIPVKTAVLDKDKLGFYTS